MLCTRQIIYIYIHICNMHKINITENLICRLFAAADNELDIIDYEVNKVDDISSLHLINFWGAIHFLLLS